MRTCGHAAKRDVLHSGMARGAFGVGTPSDETIVEGRLESRTCAAQRLHFDATASVGRARSAQELGGSLEGAGLDFGPRQFEPERDRPDLHGRDVTLGTADGVIILARGLITPSAVPS